MMIQQPMIPTNEVVTLSDREKQQISQALHHVPKPAGAIIDALKIIQHQRGWVSDGCIKALSQYIKVSSTKIDEVATFYNLIFRRPVGKVVLHPCDGISCDLMGGKKVRRCISQSLGIDNGQTSKDDQFTLIPLPCLGACDKAPVMVANRQLFERLNPDNIDALLNRLGDVQ